MTTGLAGCLLAVVALLALPVGGQEPDPPGRAYATGLIPAPPDQLAAMPRTPVFRAYLPPSVDLRNRFPPPKDQGDQGSCTAWAVGYAARSYYNSTPGSGWRLSEADVPSPSYIYNSIHDGDCDSGSFITDALDLLEQGSVSLADYPYDDDSCQRPDADTVSRATSFRIESWMTVDPDNLDQIKAELAAGHPLVISMRPDEDFHDLRGPAVWHAGWPNDEDGYHAMTVVGYSEQDQVFTLMNSWGQGWGNGGFVDVSYDTFDRRVGEAYTMRLPQEPAPPPPPAPVVDPPPPPPAPVVEELALPAVECGHVELVVEDNGQTIAGFVGSREDLEAIHDIAEPFSATVDVDLRPWPQCEALMTMETPLSHGSPPDIQLAKETWRAAETLAFDVHMAEFPGYLHIAYIQADGSVVNLVQSDPLALKTLPALAKLTFGDGLEGRARFTVSEPFGREMIIALASKSPLFADDRPRVETEREFLTALRKAIIARPDPGQPQRVVSASYVSLETGPGE